jgi:hypothetical protein
MRLVIVALCALSCGGCMQETVRFAANSEQQAIVRDGQPALVSTKKNSIVMIRPATRQFASGARPVFVVGIHNLSKAPLDFAVRNVRASQIAGNDTVAMKVIPYEELVAEERTREAVTAVLVGAAIGADAWAASEAGYRTRTTTVNSPSGSYSYRTTSYSPSTALAAERHATRQSEHLIDTAIKQGQKNLAKLERNVLKDDTLMPGEWYGGTLHLQPPTAAGDASGPKTYSIVLSVGPDEHRIDVIQDSAH